MEKSEVKLYTETELEELISWFADKELPHSYQVDKATYVPDLQDTLKRLFEQARICRENPRMQGCIFLLERIKHGLEQTEVTHS